MAPMSSDETASAVAGPRVRVLLLLITVIQLAQAHPLQFWSDSFTRSYWLVNYHFGFVRRGLAGELLSWLPDRVFPTFTALNAVAWCTGLLAGGCLAVWAWKVAERSPMLSLGLASTPAGVDFLAGLRRPDTLGLVLLLVSVQLMGRGWRTRAMLAVLWGCLALTHEGAILIWGTWLPLIAHARCEGNWWRRQRDGLVVLSAAALVMATLVLLGPPSPAQVAAIANESSAYAHPSASMVQFLPDSVKDSIMLVASLPPRSMILMLGTGLVLLLVTLWWVRESKAALPGRSFALSWWLLVIAGYLTLLATGVDWGRWFAAASLGVLISSQPKLNGTSSKSVTWGQAALATGLALVPPFPGFL